MLSPLGGPSTIGELESRVGQLEAQLEHNLKDATKNAAVTLRERERAEAAEALLTRLDAMIREIDGSLELRAVRAMLDNRRRAGAVLSNRA